MTDHLHEMPPVPGAAETPKQKTDRQARTLINDRTITSMQEFLDAAAALEILPRATLSNCPNRIFNTKGFMLEIFALQSPTLAIQRQTAHLASEVTTPLQEMDAEELMAEFARQQIADVEALHTAVETVMNDPHHPMAAFAPTVKNEIAMRRSAAALFPGQFIAGNALLMTKYNERTSPEMDEIMFRILKKLLNEGHSMTDIW